MPKLPGWIKWAAWSGLAAGVLAPLAWRYAGDDGVDRSKIYTIGYADDVPFHFKGPDGLPTGLAVELVSEAARRKNINLEWVQGVGLHTPPEPGGEDLWVLLTIRPDRAKSFHITRPYLQTETCFIVPAKGPIREVKDLASARISYLDYAIHRKNLAVLLPNMTPVPVKSSHEALEKVAAGQADAAYLDDYAAMPALLGGGFMSAMRQLPSHTPPGLMGIGATFANARVADAIRDGMELMALDGAMARSVQRWGFLPSLTSDMIETLLTERRKVAWLTLGIVVLCLSLGGSVWLLGRTRRQALNLRRSEEQLSESRARLLLAMDLARLAPWEYNVTGDHLTVEDSLYRIVGAKPPSSGTVRMKMAEYLKSFVPPDDQALVAREIGGENRPAGDAAPRRLEHRFLRADGTLGTVVVRYSVVKDSAGRTVKTYGVHQDVTEARRAEESRRVLEEQLQQAQKLESIGTLAGGIAHDFNNVLVAIMAHADLAREKGIAHSELEEHLEQVMVAGKRASDLVRRILAFSRPHRLDRRPVQAASIINEALRLLRSTLSDSIKVREETESGLPEVFADATQIHQVVMNLCSNAAHAMKGRNGDLLVRAGRAVFGEFDPRPHAGLRPGEYVQITVRDTGSGMDEATLRRIFEPFFTTKDQGEGTGLGLSTVHGIVRAHGGAITVESKPGIGSTFSVFLPCVEKSEALAENRPPIG
jgi:signal transduction histidine kinase